MKAGQKMIRIENVSKSFDNLQILKGVSLNIEKGEIFGIVGRSGVGKSTLLRCVDGLEQYNSGSIKVDGAEVGRLSPEELRLFRKKRRYGISEFFSGYKSKCL